MNNTNLNGAENTKTDKASAGPVQRVVMRRVHYSPNPENPRSYGECKRDGKVSDFRRDVTCLVCRKTKLFRDYAI